MNDALELIRETMQLCEYFPCGGVGESGPTQEELNEKIEAGRIFSDDDSFHRGQQIWLNLNKIAELVKQISAAP